MSERGDWIETYSGRKFHPLDPRPEDVEIEDIAHSLAMQCRFNGHCRFFYSVAEHSVLVARHVESVAGREAALWALLHDAAEAYVTDVPRPIKPMLRGYGEIEGRVMAAIAQRFGLPAVMPREVKEADRRILTDEHYRVMGREGPGVVNVWGTDGEALGVVIIGFTPHRATFEFLREFDRLWWGAR